MLLRARTAWGLDAHGGIDDARHHEQATGGSPNDQALEMSVATEGARGEAACVLRGLHRFEGPNLYLPQRCVVASVTSGCGQDMVPPQAARLIHDVLERVVRVSRLTPPLDQAERILKSTTAVPLADAAGAICIALQYLSGEAVTQWRVTPGREKGSAILACACEAGDIGLSALQTAAALLSAACES